MYPIKLYLRKKSNIILFTLGILFNISSWIWLFIHISKNLGQVFLHYNVLFGVDLVGSWYSVFALPLAGLLILFFNAFLGWILYKQDPFAAYILNGVTILINIILFISSAILVFLNV